MIIYFNLTSWSWATFLYLLQYDCHNCFLGSSFILFPIPFKSKLVLLIFFAVLYSRLANCNVHPFNNFAIIFLLNDEMYHQHFQGTRKIYLYYPMLCTWQHLPYHIFLLISEETSIWLLFFSREVWSAGSVYELASSASPLSYPYPTIQFVELSDICQMAFSKK